MRTNHILLLTFAALLSSCSAPREEVPVRTMRYYPDGRDIVCLNGTGRYTRALYGTHTRFRLETSDRPVFAVYDKADSRNIRFYITTDGKTLQMDSIATCEARYRGGRRSYLLKDPSWPEGASLRITTLASQFDESAVWQFCASGFASPVCLSAKVCDIACTSFKRDGDLGLDPRENFEPASDEGNLEEYSWECTGGESYFIYRHKRSGLTLTAEEGRPVFDKEEQARQELMGRVEINTPDPFFNTIGESLVAAADGIWDGSTVLHGAVGWRTQLAGWRGAYSTDVVGWNDRAVSHFRTYAHSMTRNVKPVFAHPTQDTLFNLARPEMKWGTQMYSDGYICRVPGRSDQMSHYDMNLNYIDELMLHFRYDADTLFMREMWPYIKLHHEWEKRNFDPDGDNLYDANCCIWASDALYYSAGAVTHSSAYNFSAYRQSAKIARLLGEDPAPYQAKADSILAAMNSRLWLEDKGHWAEYQDYMGLKRIHESAALWSIYTPIDCGSCTPEQAWRATLYVDNEIPHIPIRYDYDRETLEALGISLPKPEKDLFTLSTSNWLPYAWSTNNVAHEEVAAMALAYLQAGRRDSGFKLLKADLLDEMYLGECPGNFGQISFYDKARNEAYRDFADNVGITSRAVINGLFGILPNALDGECVISQAFPDEWKEASIKTPYLSYSFRREGDKDIYEIEQNFTRPLKIVVRTSSGGGSHLDVEGSSEKVQTITVDRRKLPEPKRYAEYRNAEMQSGDYLESMGLGDITRRTARKSETVDISACFNADADEIFRQEYLSPRPPYTSLELPKQGVGEWCVPLTTYEIEDDAFRALSRDGVYDSGLGLKFRTPREGHNIAYTSLWDNYPDSVSVALGGKARYAWLLMAGSTQNMQSRIENAVVRVTYTDGTTDEMPLVNPINWRPIEQDCYTDGHAFYSAGKNPYRLSFKTGEIMRELRGDLLEAGAHSSDYRPVGALANSPKDKSDMSPVTDRTITCGGALILKMPLDRRRELQSLTLRTLSNDVVVGLMAVTLEK